MGRSTGGARRPATKFPHLQKQMQKNAQTKIRLQKPPKKSKP